MAYQPRTLAWSRERRAMPVWRSHRMKDLAIAVCTILLVMIFILLPPPSRRPYDKHNPPLPPQPPPPPPSRRGETSHVFQRSKNDHDHNRDDNSHRGGTMNSAAYRREWRYGRDPWNPSSTPSGNPEHVAHSSDHWKNHEALDEAVRIRGGASGDAAGLGDNDEGKGTVHDVDLGTHRHKLIFLGSLDSRQQTQDDELITQILAILDTVATLEIDAINDDPERKESAAILTKALEYKSQWEGETVVSKSSVGSYLESQRLSNLRFTAFIVFHKEIFSELYSGLIPTAQPRLPVEHPTQQERNGKFPSTETPTTFTTQGSTASNPPANVNPLNKGPTSTHRDTSIMAENVDAGNSPFAPLSANVRNSNEPLNTTQLLFSLYCRSVASQEQLHTAENEKKKKEEGEEEVVDIAARLNCSTTASVTLSQRRTLIVFLATNPNITKHYATELTHGRLLKEWEMPGYDSETESAEHRLNQYGAMLSVYKSNITTVVSTSSTPTPSAQQLTRVATQKELMRQVRMSYFPDVVLPPLTGAPRMATMDTPQQWIAFFQYDMKLSDQLFRHIRKWVARLQTHAALLDMKATLEWEVAKATAVKNNGGLFPSWMKEKTNTNKNHKSSATTSPSSTPPACCIFFGTSEHTHYLLHNRLGMQLMKDYNAYFETTYTLNDLPPWCATDALIVPAVVFNKVMPFLNHIAEVHRHNASHFGQAIPPQTTTGPKSGGNPKDPNPSPGHTESNEAPDKNRGNREPNNNNNNDDDDGNGNGNNNNIHDHGGNDDNDGDDDDAHEGEIGYGSVDGKESAVEVMEAAVALAFGIEMIDFLSVGIPLRHLKESELEALHAH